MSDEDKIGFADLLMQRISTKYSAKVAESFVSQVLKSAWNNKDGLDIVLAKFARSV